MDRGGYSSQWGWGFARKGNSRVLTDCHTQTGTVSFLIVYKKQWDKRVKISAHPAAPSPFALPKERDKDLSRSFLGMEPSVVAHPILFHPEERMPGLWEGKSQPLLGLQTPCPGDRVPGRRPWPFRPLQMLSHSVFYFRQGLM